MVISSSSLCFHLQDSLFTYYSSYSTPTMGRMFLSPLCGKEVLIFSSYLPKSHMGLCRELAEQQLDSSSVPKITSYRKVPRKVHRKDRIKG